MLRTLGQLTVEGGGLTRPKVLLLLCYLAVEGPRPRGELRTLFWPGDSDPAAQLRSTLLRLRRGLPGALNADGELLGTALPCDAALLLRAHERGDAAEVLALYTGAFLDGVTLPLLGSELEDWVYATREVLAAQARHALLQQAQAAAGRGEYGAAGQAAARAWALRGAPACEPEELSRLHDLLLAGQHPAAAEVRREAQVFALPLQQDPLAAQARWRRPAAPRLPGLRALTVGRREERAQVLACLTGPGGRGAALCGAGGMGKTHLALELAHAVAEQEIGDVAFVPLAGVGDVRSAVGRTLQALNPQWQGGDDPQLLPEQLGTRQTLLLLDQAEDLPGFEAWLAGLLSRCPAVRVLVTSRLPVRVPGVQLLTLEGLSCAAPLDESGGAGGWSDAATLLLRAGRWSRDARLAPQDVAATEALATLLWGAPLALELAAAWTATLSPAELLAELRRDPTLLDRQSGAASPRAAFDQTWRRLGPELRAALAGLTVFHGGMSRPAAAEVVGVTLPQLAQLVEYHLLRSLGGSRFALHPLIRAYAAEHLRADAAWGDTVRKRHTRYGLRLLTEGGGQGAEFDDVAAAWRRTLAAGDAAPLAAAAAGLRALAGRAWRQREGAALLEAVLSLAGSPAAAAQLETQLAWLRLQCGDVQGAAQHARRGLTLAPDDRARQRSLHVLGSVLRQSGAWPEAQACWEEVLRQAPTDSPLAWRTLESLAILEEQRGQVAAAELLYLEVLAGRRRAPQRGEDLGLARALLNYAALLLNAERPAEAFTALQEVRARLEQAGDRALEPWLLVNLAETARQQGEVQTALGHCEAAWAAIEGGESPLRAMLLDTRARTRRAAGNPGGAAADAWQALDEAWRRGARPAILERLTLAASLLQDTEQPAGAWAQAPALRAWLAGQTELPHWSRRDLGEMPSAPPPGEGEGSVGAVVMRVLNALAARRT